MTFSLSLRGLASRLLPCNSPIASTTTRSLSTTAPIFRNQPSTPKNKQAKASGKATKGKGGKSKKGRADEKDPKVINMLQYMSMLSPGRLPPPLRMARNRHLRHWTIHRAWLMFRRKEREARETNLMRQHQSISAACEVLRLTEGPGSRDEGYLYRVAMEKKAVYGLGGIPIEYARAQTETPARVAWNHEWKR